MDRDVIEQKLESLRRCLKRVADKCLADPAAPVRVRTSAKATGARCAGSSVAFLRFAQERCCVRYATGTQL